MADSTLANLSASGAVAATDLFYSVVTAGVGGVKATAAQLKTFMSASPLLVTPSLGAATGTTLALGGASLSGNSLATVGSIQVGTNISVISGIFFGTYDVSKISSPSSGVILLQNAGATDFTRLQFGGTTSSFPSIKKSSTILQARLADDSAFAPLQGALRTAANAVAETITADHTLVITDASGQAYRVPCQV